MHLAISINLERRSFTGDFDRRRRALEKERVSLWKLCDGTWRLDSRTGDTDM
jgi:hypothetical protein